MTPASNESEQIERKSIRKVTGSSADFGELAQECVCFANSAGGTLFIGTKSTCQRHDRALSYER
jgi:ATP-dependent DNA helicase RecG